MSFQIFYPKSPINVFFFLLELSNCGNTTIGADIKFNINIKLDPLSIGVDDDTYVISIEDDILYQHAHGSSNVIFQTDLSKKNQKKLRENIKEFFKYYNILPNDGCFNFDTKDLLTILQS